MDVKIPLFVATLSRQSALETCVKSPSKLSAKGTLHSVKVGFSQCSSVLRKSEICSSILINFFFFEVSIFVLPTVDWWDN